MRTKNPTELCKLTKFGPVHKKKFTMKTFWQRFPAVGAVSDSDGWWWAAVAVSGSDRQWCKVVVNGEK